MIQFLTVLKKPPETKKQLQCQVFFYLNLRVSVWSLTLKQSTLNIVRYFFGVCVCVVHELIFFNQTFVIKNG